jgi:hypothetical protein
MYGKTVVGSYESLLLMKVQVKKNTFVLHDGFP